MTAIPTTSFLKENEKTEFGNHNSDVKHISIILTQFDDMFSSIIRFVAKQEYTHVSLALEGYDKAFTFNYRGFALEKPYTLFRRKKGTNMILEVSDEQYKIIERQVLNFQRQSSTLKYTHLGVIFCALNISITIKKRYFCSQFVAEVLKNSGIHLRKESQLYLPQNLYQELLNNKQVYKIINN
ncbi:MAG: hypothetical protein ACK5LC_09450 [Coprobacillaceae bacterium]